VQLAHWTSFVFTIVQEGKTSDLATERPGAKKDHAFDFKNPTITGENQTHNLPVLRQMPSLKIIEPP
jgi:hypothetical protein